jgi:hypothetical protein
MIATDAGRRAASRPAGVFASPNAAPIAWHGHGRGKGAKADGGFAIWRSGAVSSRLFFHFGRCYRERMNYKGTMGTWEQAPANRQNALLWRGADLFPRIRGRLGTWEQNAPLPSLENPRACGIPLPRASQ